MSDATLRSHLVLFVIVLLVNLWLFRYFLVTLGTAASIAILLSPLYERCSSELKGRRSVAAVLTVAMVTVVVLVPILGYGTYLTEQAIHVFDQLRPYLEGDAISDLWTRVLPE
ncbi:MAG: hypothetical protein ACRD21_06005, partial [Vicinamibacteria bacterium]